VTAIDIRAVEPRDLPQFVLLCREHASFERGDARDLEADRLHAALFSRPARLHAWVACDREGPLIGYATATIDYSTWRAREFMHLDCLFVRESLRGLGVGHELLRAVCESASKLGIDEVQWQTPQWNTRAQRFYERVGAVGLPKMRFTLGL
jgi:GNAT superfamily N-acetyltransferase